MCEWQWTMRGCSSVWIRNCYELLLILVRETSVFKLNHSAEEYGVSPGCVMVTLARSQLSSQRRKRGILDRKICFLGRRPWLFQRSIKMIFPGGLNAAVIYRSLMLLNHWKISRGRHKLSASRESIITPTGALYVHTENLKVVLYKYYIPESVIVRMFTLRKWLLTEAKPRSIIIFEG